MRSLPKVAHSTRISPICSMRRCFIPQAWSSAACCQRLSRQASRLTVTDIKSTATGGVDIGAYWKRAGNRTWIGESTSPMLFSRWSRACHSCDQNELTMRPRRLAAAVSVYPVDLPGVAPSAERTFSERASSGVIPQIEDRTRTWRPTIGSNPTKR